MIKIKRATDFTPDIARDLWEYDPSTGDITWKEVPEKYFADTKYPYKSMIRWNRSHRGKVATRKCRNVHYVSCKVRFREVSANAHRIAWMIHTGEIPPKSIDHINRDATDNRWDNLRDGTKLNKLNRSLSINSTTGVTGVRWDRNNMLWKCELQGKFLGRYDTLLDAVAVIFNHAREIGVPIDSLTSRAWYHPS